jgi:intracellular sulfur oxidation DsrE/DsrF family protein
MEHLSKPVHDLAVGRPDTIEQIRNAHSGSDRASCKLTRLQDRERDHMKKLWLLVLAVFLFFVPYSMWAQSKGHHVLFAMTSPNESDWMLTFGNIANLKKGLAPEPVEVEVVAYGPGIAMVKKTSAAAAQIEALEKDGVRFVACENSMRHMQLTAADLASGVGTVPSGIVEVVKKQEAGWSYVKAGQ